MKHPKTGHPLQKAWGWFSTRGDVRKVLNQLCQHKVGEHDPIEGDVTSGTAVYPPRLCLAFAKVLMDTRYQCGKLIQRVVDIKHAYVNEPEDISLEDEYPSPSLAPDPDPEDPADSMRLDQEAASASEAAEPEPGSNPDSWSPAQVKNRLRTIHANLGHPSNAVLCRLLREAKASQSILDAAAKFECDLCRQRGHAAMHRTSHVKTPKEKWEVISVDTFYWYSLHRDEKGNPIIQAVGLSVMDETTDYHLGCVVRTGGKRLANLNGDEFIKAINSCWLKQFPQPKVIRMDTDGAFTNPKAVSWLEGQGIQVSVVPGEAAYIDRT